ncbi:dihydrofolate reductase family protein [Paraliomyxa miuraensis]|uniref:dihydrofolate reductase family protein n=1 Tax=Paraliomyxa miuraensis TaxID=376150 RepID=UPI00224D433E|nr:dihydrofolate reductase family protein [Paraliomyxa miuraensis]MCX4245118.1 dihydrofolate reductase family protein [Paraliomyxa miuraensis]
MATIEHLPPAVAVAERVRRLYGDESLSDPAGVVHVAAVGREPDGGLVVLKINQSTPHSLHDRFALDLARARADVIVTTGAILRAEPGLRYELASDRADALHTWRMDQLGRPTPPLVVVLTGREDIDLDHPTLHGWAQPWIFTNVDAAKALHGRLPQHVGLAGVPSPDLETLIEWAQRRFDARTITIEAGPATTRPLYEEGPCLVDELMLSVFEGTIPTDARGDPFASERTLERLFPRRHEGEVVEENSGPWRFVRLLRTG